jgi:hypothetical protein
MFRARECEQPEQTRGEVTILYWFRLSIFQWTFCCLKWVSLLNLGVIGVW